MGTSAALAPKLARSPIKESEWIVLMDIMKDNLSEMDCLLMQPKVQARANKEKRQTEKYTEMLTETRMK